MIHVHLSLRSPALKAVLLEHVLLRRTLVLTMMGSGSAQDRVPGIRATVSDRCISSMPTSCGKAQEGAEALISASKENKRVVDEFLLPQLFSIDLHLGTALIFI